eukprot:3775531-Pyramimonas_sp.AAC.1
MLQNPVVVYAFGPLDFDSLTKPKVLERCRHARAATSACALRLFLHGVRATARAQGRSNDFETRARGPFGSNL